MPAAGVTTQTPIEYRVAMPEPASHEFDVEMRVPALPDHETAEIVFPTWAPGSYMVRDFVRHVFRLTVTDERGRPLARERLDKQRWRITTGGRAFRVRYRVFAFEATVRTSFLDDSHGYFNGTSVFFHVDGELGAPLPRDGRAAAALRLAGGHRAARRAGRARHLRRRRLRRAVRRAVRDRRPRDARLRRRAARSSSWRSTAATTPTSGAWSTS